MKNKTELEEFIAECDCDVIRKIREDKSFHKLIVNDGLNNCHWQTNKNGEYIWTPVVHQLIDMLGDRFVYLCLHSADNQFHVNATGVKNNQVGKSPRLALIRAVKEVMNENKKEKG